MLRSWWRIDDRDAIHELFGTQKKEQMSVFAGSNYCNGKVRDLP
jgi:hypothetical protein